MVDPDPSVRPSAARLKRHPLLHPAGNKSKTQLRRELAAAKMKNELLARKLQEAARWDIRSQVNLAVYLFCFFTIYVQKHKQEIKGNIQILQKKYKVKVT